MYAQNFSSLERDVQMKLVNWNVNRATPQSKNSRGVEIRNRIDRHSPEIVCLTETHPKLLKDGYKISAGIKESCRKVLLWSREPWKCENHLDDDRMPPGRFISGVTRISVGEEVTVVGLCIPWRESRTVKYGGVCGEWEDHKVYLEHLAGVLKRAPSKRLVVMGDFNQCIRPRRAGSEAYDRATLLREAIPPHVTLITSDLECRGRRTIDHIGLSDDMETASLDVISDIPGERRLSDRGRFGVVADVLVRSS